MSKNKIVKRQIRTCVFETNSSSQHSLCMKKGIGDRTENIKRLSEIANDNVITLFKTDPDTIMDMADYVMDISGMDMQRKLDLLSYSAIVGNTNEFIKYICYIRDMLYFNYGIDIQVEYDNLNKAADMCFYFDIFRHLSDELALDLIETFLFTDWCFYTRYDDDFGPIPKEIEEIQDIFFSMPENECIMITKRGS